MFRIASISLFTAYIFLLQFITTSQIGPDWEIPYAILKKSRLMLVVGLLFVIISGVLVLISYKSFDKYRISIKVIYISLIIIALGIIGLGLGGVFYQLPIRFPMLSSIIKYVFWPGLIISFVLLVKLLVGSATYH